MKTKFNYNNPLCIIDSISKCIKSSYVYTECKLFPGTNEKPVTDYDSGNVDMCIYTADRVDGIRAEIYIRYRSLKNTYEVALSLLYGEGTDARRDEFVLYELQFGTNDIITVYWYGAQCGESTAEWVRENSSLVVPMLAEAYGMKVIWRERGCCES